MHIPDKLLNSIACFIMALFFILILISFKQVDKTGFIKTRSSPIEYWKGVPLARMGLELVPLCGPIQVSIGPEEKFIPTIGVNGGITGIPYTAHILWTEPRGDAREVIEAAGPIDGGGFCEPRLVTPANGYNSYNPMAASGMHNVYIGFMDEVMKTREIWFSAGSDVGWSNAEIVSSLDVDSRSWSPNPVAFFDGTSGYELPLMLWFDHRYIRHEIFIASREKGVNFLGPGRGGFMLESSGWHSAIRITEDDWDQYNPHADWSSSCGNLERNVIHLVYCDARYDANATKPDDGKGNFEIFYRGMRPVGPLITRDKEGNVIPIEQEWDVGEEIRLSNTNNISDAPSVCGKKFEGNADLDTAMVVWHEHDDSHVNGEVHFRLIKKAIPGKVRLLSPANAVAIYPVVTYASMEGHKDLAAVCYQQYEKGESYPNGTANIYMRIIDGGNITEPIKISDSRFTCGFPRITHPGYKLEGESYILVAWAEWQSGKDGGPDENQVFFRSFKVGKR